MVNLSKQKTFEKGSAGTKLLLVGLGLFIVGHALINFIPVAYSGENFKQEMQTAVVQGMSVPPSVGNAVEVTKKRLHNSALSNQLPPDAVIEVKLANSILQAHVSYSKQVPILPFGIYNYDYKFNFTATPSGYFTKEN